MNDLARPPPPPPQPTSTAHSSSLHHNRNNHPSTSTSPLLDPAIDPSYPTAPAPAAPVSSPYPLDPIHTTPQRRESSAAWDSQTPGSAAQSHYPQQQGQSGQQGQQGQQQPPQQDVDDFLRKKRKAREHKACYPCRQRKVKCDLSRPCQTCRDRDHPELCAYHPPSKRQNVRQDTTPTVKIEDVAAPNPPSIEASLTPTITLARAEFDMLCTKLSGLENSIADLRRELRRNGGSSQLPTTTEIVRRPSDASFHPSPRATFFPSPSGLNHHHSPHAALHPPPPPTSADGSRERRQTHIDVHGFHTRNDAGDIVHVGGSSIPAMLYALGQGRSEGSPLQEMLGKTALPLFGLDNESATYPFVDLWGLPHGSLMRAKELAKALPNDDQLLKLVRAYKDMGYLIFASVVDPDRLVEDAKEFIRERAAHAATDSGVTEREIYGKSYYWLGLLFAVLASGAQGSMLNRRERELTSQVYICCSFECLRFTNFLSLANLESVQSLVVIGHVLTNNTNAGTAWSFHGLTVRIAQSLGLHQASPPIYPAEKVLPRSKIWWSIIWLDSLLSIGYDRPSSAYYETSSMPMPHYYGDIRPYHTAMYSLSRIALDIVRDRALGMSEQDRYDRIMQHRDAVAHLMSGVEGHLRDSRLCQSARETIEHWGLYLHTSYSLAELYRPAISPNADPAVAQDFRQLCIENLVHTVEAYLGLNNITSFAKNSWAALQRGLSSALLLGILGEHSRSEHVWRLISHFQAVLQNIIDNVDPQEISAPVRRGLSALRRLRLADTPPTALWDENHANANGGEPAGPGSGTYHAAVLPARVNSHPTSGSGVHYPSSSAGHHPGNSGYPISSAAVHALGGPHLPPLVDSPRVFTPASSTGSAPPSEDASPYTLLHSILWGEDSAFPRPEGVPRGWGDSKG